MIAIARDRVSSSTCVARVNNIVVCALAANQPRNEKRERSQSNNRTWIMRVTVMSRTSVPVNREPRLVVTRRLSPKQARVAATLQNRSAPKHRRRFLSKKSASAFSVTGSHHVCDYKQQRNVVQLKPFSCALRAVRNTKNRAPRTRQRTHTTHSAQYRLQAN